MIEKLIVWWRSLDRRERRLLSAGAAVLLLLVGFLVLFEPAWKGRRAVSAEMPILRSKVAQIDALSAEARRLAALPVGNDSPQATRQAFEASIEAAGLKPYLSQLKVSGDVMDVRFKEVPFSTWIEWMDNAVRETRLRVVDAAVQREAQIGRVSVKMSLEVPKRDSK